MKYLIIERLIRLQQDAKKLQNECEGIAQQLGFEIVGKISDAINQIVVLEKAEYDVLENKIFLQIHMACDFSKLSLEKIEDIIGVKEYEGIGISMIIVDNEGKKGYWVLSKNGVITVFASPDEIRKRV